MAYNKCMKERVFFAVLVLRKLRKERRVSQQMLADYLGVTQATLSGWENEKYEMDKVNLCKVADYFGVTTDYILGRTDNSAPPDAKKDAPEGAPVDDSFSEAMKLFRELPPDLQKIGLEHWRLLSEIAVSRK